MDMPAIRITYVYTRMSHHSPHSGYDRISSYIASTVQRPNLLHKLLGLFPERALGYLRKSAGPWYNSAALKQELQAAARLLFAKKQLCHFLYGEDTFHYTGYCASRSANRLVATYHMPPEKFRAINQGTRHLKTLDGLVIVAPNQEQLFKNIVRPERVHLIPHGVDTRFFHPGGVGPHRKKQCLFVGSHLRDFQMLRRVMQELNARDREISFAVVTQREQFRHFSGLQQVTLFSAITEGQLVHLYRTSALLLLPLLDATANNTMLEAMACGLPVVATDAGGVRMYGTDGGAVFVQQGDAEQMSREALRILYSEELAQSLSRDARSSAERFDWSIVAAQMQRLYERLFG